MGAIRLLVDPPAPGAWNMAVDEVLLEAAAIPRAATFCRSAGGAQSGHEPFLCFERRTCGDIILGDAKIVGSAQRRRRGAVLQHGSVLLSRSDFALELPGIAELRGVEVK